MKKQVLPIIVVLALIGCRKTEVSRVITAPPISASSLGIARTSTSSAPSLRIAVPFSPQAPFANWDAAHEEACEEMALLMVAHYWQGTPLPRDSAERELEQLLQWETQHGYPEDVTAEQLGEIATRYFHLRATTETDVTVAAIRKHLAAGRPVIVPTAGRLLGNPYYSGEGPWYHMLVLTGYRDGRVITNDPGTKRGESYEYDESTLLRAIHDWTGVKEQIATGAKTMLIVER